MTNFNQQNAAMCGKWFATAIYKYIARNSANSVNS